MTKLIINGGKALKGTITPVANKNSVIKMIPAALLTDEIVTIHNVPMSSDVKYMCQIVEKLGGKVEYLNNNTTLKIDCSTVNRFDIDPELSDKMKASVMFLGPLLIKFGKAQMPTPQGCKLGTRPLDSLIQNMIDIGADYKHENGNYYLSIDQSKISGKEIRSRFPSVTGTENLIIFATKIQGTTIIYNAACEPHTQELCHFLNARGANISGIGSNKIIIEGVGHLKGVEWTVDSDHLDVGGFIAATVMTGGELTIKNAVVKHMDMILQVYKKLGVTVEIDRAKDEIFVPKNQKLVIDKTVKGDLFDIKALHRPLFPADLNHVASVLALKA
ncbi:MAG TPA: hypothetical protein PKC14_04465, partial [Candidatus Absconditabacterales bacterium]|nr:hypothetical protein [Candidatus Absconditabacterales bacterium]